MTSEELWAIEKAYKNDPVIKDLHHAKANVMHLSVPIGLDHNGPVYSDQTKAALHSLDRVLIDYIRDNYSQLFMEVNDVPPTRLPTCPIHPNRALRKSVGSKIWRCPEAKCTFETNVDFPRVKQTLNS